MKRTHQDNGGGTSSGASANSYPLMDNGKAKMWDDCAGEDELLAILGYKVRSSDMADVAQKMEQLEMMIGAGTGTDDGTGLLTHLGSDTVHYNPADLSTWLESMLSEAEITNILPNQSFQNSLGLPFTPTAESSTITTVDYPTPHHPISSLYDEPICSDYDLSVIPGDAIFGERDRKRIKHEITNSSLMGNGGLGSGIGGVGSGIRIGIPEPTRPVVLVDSQENGIRLVHTLMACAEAVQQDDLKMAESLVKQVSLLAASQAGAMKKVATYFAEALARRIYRFYPQPSLDSSFSDILQIHFYETCPHLKFAHFTANQAILDSLIDSPRVHIIDFSMKQGIQWPGLMQQLAMRPLGGPSIRITGIGPPQPDNSDALQQVGWKLAQFAENLHVEFEYRGFVTNSLADLDASMMDLRPGETVVVNSVFELHPLLARPGAIEKVLGTIRDMKPQIVTVIEQEASHNGPVFLDRFTQALHYYSTLFDSLEGGAFPPVSGQNLVMSEMYFGRQICNLVACEGVDRVERHESLIQWRDRFESAGLELSPLGSNSFKQVSHLLGMFDGASGYRVDEREGCLMLGWHTRPLVTSSVWQLADSDSD